MFGSTYGLKPLPVNDRCDRQSNPGYFINQNNLFPLDHPLGLKCTNYSVICFDIKK